MKALLFISLIFGAFYSDAQAKEKQQLKTNKYAGVYSFGKIESRNGHITIYPETDSTVLFYIQLSNGAPGYHEGQLYDRMKIKNDTGYYFMSEQDGAQGCKWQIIIKKDMLTIKTIDGSYWCGFGADVYADHRYKKKKGVSSDFFIDLEQKKVFFNTTALETY